MPIYGVPFRLSNASKFRACVDGVRNGEPYGRLASPYLPQPAAFEGVLDLMSQIDSFLTRIGFPRAHTTYRTFGPADNNPARQQEIEESNEMSQEMFEAKLGEKATFVIQVQFRQNSTWQGTITWTEEKRTQHFRSTLEMIKLMDSALEAQGEENFSAWETGRNKISV